MSKLISLSKALQNWDVQHPGQSYMDAVQIKLCFQSPPIQKLQTAALNQLAKCERLSLSSNNIDKMINFPPMKNLTRLSLSRNLIKKISGLDDIAGNLKQLWLSYNLIQKLDGLNGCIKLTTLFIGNNKIKAWEQLDKIKQLPQLENVLFFGQQAKFYVLKKLPNAKNIDGTIVTNALTSKAEKLPDTFPPPIK